MQPLRFAGNPETGLVHVFDRRLGNMITHGLGEGPQPFGVLHRGGDAPGASAVPEGGGSTDGAGETENDDIGSFAHVPLREPTAHIGSPTWADTSFEKRSASLA